MLTNESESDFITELLSPAVPTSENLLTLDLGDRQISSDLVLEQLAAYRLLPQQIEEIILDKLLTQTLVDLNIHIGYSSVEFQEIYTLNRQSRSCQGMNATQLTAISARELKLQKFKQLRWGDLVAAYFEEHRSQLDRVTISTIEVDNSFIANELFFRIQAGERSFTEIALEYSQNVYGHNGGKIGPVFWRELSPQIGRVVRKLQPGELSIPLSMGGKYRLIRLERLEPAQLNAQMHQFLLDELFTTWFKSEITVGDRVKIDFPPDLIVDCLSKSKLLIPYLRSTIVRSTLTAWQQSAEDRTLLANVPPISADLDSSQPLPKSIELQQYQQAQWGHLLHSRFLQSKSQLDRVVFSAIQVADFHLAVELHARVLEGEQSLAQLAIDYSQHPTAKLGGTVGPIALTQLHPLIYRHLTGLKPQQLSPIFQLESNYVFLRLECWLPVKFDRQIQQHFLDELFEQWLEQQVVDRIGLVVWGGNEELAR
jgi:parvulin-like peptidyl-prolyl isomerase